MKHAKILGFPLHYKKGKWYGVKFIDSKLRWVYIGDDIEKAEEKIKAWCEKHKIEIPELRDKFRFSIREKNSGIKEVFSEEKIRDKFRENLENLTKRVEVAEKKIEEQKEENLWLRTSNEELKKAVESLTNIVESNFHS